MTFSAALLGVLLQRFSVPVWAACAVVLVVAVALGILYTVLSSRLQIPLFYLSLCVHLLLDGLNGFFYRMTRQTSNYAYAGADRTRWLGVPLWCWIALAALALADAAGLPRASSLKALTTFTGLPHRFEVVLEHNGVRWVNDSKATNVGSTEAALNGLHVDGTLHLLLGGDGKSADFSPLARYLNGDNVRLYCFGRDGAQLAALRPEVAEQTETMEQAMRLLAPRVQPGDMVLLSPACASLDQFKNFEQRGNEFARLAKELG